MADIKLTIGVFGRRRAGKTSLVHSLGGKATPPAGPGATDETAVKLEGIGRTCIVLPAGLDDERALGVEAGRAREILQRIGLAVVVIDASLGWSDYERFLLSKLRFSGTPAIAVVNRTPSDDTSELLEKLDRFGVPSVEAVLDEDLDPSAVVQAIASEFHRRDEEPNLLAGLLGQEDILWVVVPANRPSYVGPFGPSEERLARDAGRLGVAVSMVEEPAFLDEWESGKKRPTLIVADATVFGAVDQVAGASVPITTLSILIARQRGELVQFVRGAQAISKLSPGDRVLIAESCLLHVQPGDVGRTEIPNLLRKWVGGDLEFSAAAGSHLLDSIQGYQLVVRCGACMQNGEDARAGLELAARQNVPVTNYGFALAYLHGVLGRLVQPFVEAGELVAPEVDQSRSIPLVLHDEYSIPPSM